MTIFKNNFGLLGLPNLGVTGINPNAQMPNMGLQQQLPSGGMGGQPTILNQMPTMYNAPQPMSFADRLRNIGQRMFDYGVGYNKAGAYSFDPSAGDPKLPHTLGFENMQRQALNRAKLANTLQQQQFNNQIALRNQMTKDQKNFAYRESLPDDEKETFDKFISTSSFSGQPASVKEWQYFNSLSKDDQNKYLNMKRQAFRLQDTGSTIQFINPQGEVEQDKSLEKTLSPEQQPENIIKKKEAEEKGKELGQLRIQYPQIQSEMKQKVNVIDDILTDPNLDDYLGAN